MTPQRTSGIATVLFTDVEASTDTTTRLGDDAAGPLLATHHRIVRDQIVAHGGRHIESTGDGFMALFDSTRSAVDCALAIQDELAQREEGIRVRIGVNAGEVQEGEDGLFGAAINLAKRVMDRADGGQILVTDAVRHLAGTMPSARFIERGRVALKGFPERQRLYEVRAANGRAPPRRKPVRRRSRRPAALAAVLGLAAATAIAGVLLATGEAEQVQVRPNSVAILDADDGRVVAQVPVGIRPSILAAAGDSVWVGNLADDTLTQIEARSRRVAATVSPGIDVDGLAAGPGAVWVAENARAAARVIDPDFPRTVARSVPIGDLGASGAGPDIARPLAVTADAVWVSYGLTQIARLDPASGRVVARMPVGNAPAAIAVGAGAVWVSDDLDGTVTRIDPATNDVVARIAVGQSASGLAAGAGGVWVAVPLEDRVKRIDPASNAVADTVRVSGGPAGVAIGAGAVWVTSRRAGTVTRIDPGAARAMDTFRLGNSPQGVAVVGGSVWVAMQASAAPPARADRAADVLAVLRPEGMEPGTDPVLAGIGPAQNATCALLLNYRDEPSPAGQELIPEVARAMPEVSDDGRTYTFRLRSGFRFSPPSGAPVTADAFRHAIERALHPRSTSFAPFIMGDIAGFARYRAGRAEHLAGVVARGDTLVVRLRTPSASLPARLAGPYFCAVPPTTPLSASGIERIPTAGPYYYASYVPKRRAVLLRNPNYGGSRPARAREIDIDLDVSTKRAAAMVEAGEADYTSAVPENRVDALDRRYGPQSAAARAGGQRYFSGHLPVLHFFVLNARRPLLAGTRMRQAVNAALDRRALARRVHSFSLFGLSQPGRPTDQLIPPGLPGFRDVSIYSLGAPDVERARRLAGGRRRRAVLYTCDLPHCLEHGRVARRNLAAIGIDVTVKSFTMGQMFTRLQRPGEPWDIGYYNYFIDHADPTQWTVEMFKGSGPPTNIGSFRDEEIERRARALTRRRTPDRLVAFAALDADLARAGAVAPFATATTTDFFSARVGCQVHQPVNGVLLGSLCIRR